METTTYKRREKCEYYREKDKSCFNGCARLNDDVKCEPSTCEWYATHQDVIDSLQKARQNYFYKHGTDRYVQSGLCPKVYEDEVLRTPLLSAEKRAT